MAIPVGVIKGLMILKNVLSRNKPSVFIKFRPACPRAEGLAALMLAGLNYIILYKERTLNKSFKRGIVY